MSTKQPQNTSYGLSQAVINNSPQPISARRAPLASDFMQVGTVWCNILTNSVYILTSITSNSANWQSVGGGGTGTFSALTVTPGPISLTGTTTINTTGNANTSIGNATGTVTVLGTTNINATGTDNTNIGNATGSVDITGDVTLTDGDLDLVLGDITLSGAASNVVVQANGSFQFEATAYILAGVGDPNGTVAALQGSIYLNATGSGVANRLWVNTDGISTWTAVSTVA